jgi:nucleoside-diphosphate-sugar epimerase
MKIAITGSRSEIALALAATLEQPGTAVALFPPADILDLTGPIDPVTEWLARERPDAVVHLAGAVPPRPAAELFAVNAGGTYTLLAAIARRGTNTRVIVASSAAIYGQSEAGNPIRESAVPRPCNAYGAAKFAQEHVALMFGSYPSIGITIARIFNTCGPTKRNDLPLRALAAKLIATPDGTNISLGGGHVVRDYIDIRDVACALATLLTTPSPPAIVNIATGTGTTLVEIAQRLGTMLGKRISLAVPADESERTVHSERIAYSVADTTLLRDLGWQPRYLLDDALAELVAEARSHELAST